MNKTKRGYTMIEIMIATLVIAVLASLAIPRFTTTLELYRSREGVMALNQLLHGMLLTDVDVDEGRVAAPYALADIDVVPAIMDHFAPPVLDFDGADFTTVTIDGNVYSPYAHVDRSNGTYSLYILPDGTILCDAEVICTRMRYQPW